MPNNLNNFYKNCFGDVNDNCIKDLFKNYDKTKVPDATNSVDIEKIFDNKEFINLINKIMTSDVMKDAYNRLYIWYSTDGEFDINKDYLEESDFPKENDQKHNLINGKSIKDYYDEFCKSITNLNYFNRFIIMALQEEIKCFIFLFLKICLNYEGTNLKYNKLKNK